MCDVQGNAYTAPSGKAPKYDIENPGAYRVALGPVPNSENAQSPSMGPLAAGLGHGLYPINLPSTVQGMPVSQWSPQARRPGVSDLNYSPYAPNVRSRRSATPKTSEGELENKSPEQSHSQPWMDSVSGATTAASHWLSGRDS